MEFGPLCGLEEDKPDLAQSRALGHPRGRDRGFRSASPRVSVLFFNAGGSRLLPKIALFTLMFITRRRYRQDSEYYPDCAEIQ